MPLSSTSSPPAEWTADAFATEVVRLNGGALHGIVGGRNELGRAGRPSGNGHSHEKARKWP